MRESVKVCVQKLRDFARDVDDKACKKEAKVASPSINARSPSQQTW